MHVVYVLCIAFSSFMFVPITYNVTFCRKGVLRCKRMYLAVLLLRCFNVITCKRTTHT